MSKLNEILRLHVIRVAEAEQATRGLFKIDNKTFKEQYDWSEKQATKELLAWVDEVIGEDEKVTGKEWSTFDEKLIMLRNMKIETNRLRAEQRKRVRL